MKTTLEERKKRKIEYTTKREREAYFKTLIRFPAGSEEAIRQAAEKYGSLNGFVVAAVMRAIEAETDG